MRGTVKRSRRWYFRHPSESWGLLKRFNNGTGSGDASLRWHDGFGTVA
jgi:hypothetical protein